MFYCDKATSVLFPQIDKVIQVYSCRINNLFFCPFGSGNKNRTTQKTIRCKNECVGPTKAQVESVHTDTDDDEIITNDDLDETCLDSCPTEDSTISESTPDKTYKMYEIDDINQYCKAPTRRSKNLTDKGKINEHDKVSICKKIYRLKRKSQLTHKDTGAQSKKDKKVNVKTKTDSSPVKMPSKLVNTNQTKFNKKSLVSLYRKRKCKRKCPFYEKDKLCKNCNFLTEKINTQFEMKPKEGKGKNELTGEENPFKSKLTDKTCVKGLCSKAMKMKDKEFVCSCEFKKVPEPPPVRCTDKTCSNEYNMSKKSSLIKFKDKVSEVFLKCSKKIMKYGRNVKIDPNAICEKGICKNAYDKENQDIYCKCKLKVKKCTDTTCYPSKSQSFYKKIQGKLGVKKSMKHIAKEGMKKNVVVQNEIEQTGDPFFEIKVNAMDMCVLNSSEIKDKVMSLGREKKQEECICRSHADRKQYILEKEACLSGVCRKAFKNKRTDFTCNCLKNKVWTCTDSTCNKLETSKTDDICPCENKSPKESKNDKPLFEVQVDTKNMCIINTHEIRNKLEDIKIRSNKLCRSGICKEKSKDHNTRIVCNCKKEMKYNECEEGTCQKTKKKNITHKCCRCGKPRNKKMVRSNLDSASLKNITSKFSCYCSRMFSQSDNRVNSKKQQRRRNNKRRSCMLCTQSDNTHNTHKRLGFKIMIKQQNAPQKKLDGHRYVGKCCTCDYDKMTTQKHVEKTKEIVGDSVAVEKVTKAKNIKKSKNLEKPEEVIKKRKDIDQSTKQKVKPETDKSTKQNFISSIKKLKKQKVTSDSDKSTNQNVTTNTKKSKKQKVTPDTDKPTKKKTKKTKESTEPEKASKKKVRQRNGVVVPVPSSKLAKKSSKIVKKKIQAICKCHHICECDLEIRRRKKKEKSHRKRHKKSGKEMKKLKKKRKSNTDDRKWMKESLEKRKLFAKERNKMMKEEERRRKKQKKEEMEVLKLLESKDGTRRTNCFVEIFGAILSVGLQAVKIFFGALFKIIKNPKGSYWYTRERMQDPQATLVSIKRYLRDGWRIRKLKISKCMQNSETVGVLSDTFKESTLYQTFADKGKTKKEQQKYEAESKIRKRRVRKRNDAALYGCRHVLLMTLRKRPCLWVYHICPELYPQCLSCLAFISNFSHMCLFVLALVCWTPCIACCELMRGLCCCLLCTG